MSYGSRSSRVSSLPHLVLGVLLGWLLATVSAAALEVPYLSGRVNDLAGLLNDAAEQRLEQKLAEIERSTGAQVVVLTLPSLEGENLEEYSHRVASTWQLGQKGQDNGVLFLIARDDRKMRLEVGYGLEAVLPDLASRRILDHVVRPRFRAGDFAGGIEAGVEAIAKSLKGESLPPQALANQPHEEIPWWLKPILGVVFLAVIGIFSLIALLGSGCQSWFLYLFLLPFWSSFPSVFLHPLAGPIAGALWLLFFPALKLWSRKTAAGRALIQRFSRLAPLGTPTASQKGGTFGNWSSFGGSWGSFGGGGSSFRGGGGSFGGGGASSQW
jgi:uncharacterized protein